MIAFLMEWWSHEQNAGVLGRAQNARVCRLQHDIYSNENAKDQNNPPFGVERLADLSCSAEDSVV